MGCSADSSKYGGQLWSMVKLVDHRASTANSLRGQKSLHMLVVVPLRTDAHTVVMTERARDDHLAIRCIFVSRTSPNMPPRLGLWFGSGITLSTDVGKEILASDSFHGVFVMRSHL